MLGFARCLTFFGQGRLFLFDLNLCLVILCVRSERKKKFSVDIMQKGFVYFVVFLLVFATVVTHATPRPEQEIDPEAHQLENITPVKRFVAGDDCMTFLARCDRDSVYCNKELPGTCRREDTGLWSRSTECQDYVSVYGPCMPSGMCHGFSKTCKTRIWNHNRRMFTYYADVFAPLV